MKISSYLKYWLFLLYTICSAQFVFSQQQVAFSQYVDNMMYYNPAYAGRSSETVVSLAHHQQWVGFEGAPLTDVLTIRGRLDKYNSVGLGGVVLYDQIGDTKSGMANICASYTLKMRGRALQRKHSLSFGALAGLGVWSMTGDEFTGSEIDPEWIKRNQSVYRPNFGAGIYYKGPVFFAGISVPSIYTTGKFESINIGDARHYYLSAGGCFKLTDAAYLRPSTLMVITNNAPVSLDLSLMAVLKEETVYVGVNWQLFRALEGQFQYRFNSKFKLGYSFGFPTTTLIKGNYGSHEVMMEFKIGGKQVWSDREYYNDIKMF